MTIRKLIHEGLRSITRYRSEVSTLTTDACGIYASSFTRCAGLASTSGASASPSLFASTAFTAGCKSRWGYATSAAQASVGGKKRRVAAASTAQDDPHFTSIILRADVKGVGRRGDVVLVKRGLMRHELYPTGQAAYATPENVAKYSLTEEEKEAQTSQDTGADGLAKLLKALHTKPVVITRLPDVVNPERFVGQLDSAALRAAVLRQRSIQLHHSHFLMDTKIDTFGTYKVPLNLRLPDNQQVELTVHVDRRGKQQLVAAAEAEASKAGP